MVTRWERTITGCQAPPPPIWRIGPSVRKICETPSVWSNSARELVWEMACISGVRYAPIWKGRQPGIPQNLWLLTFSDQIRNAYRDGPVSTGQIRPYPKWTGYQSVKNFLGLSIHTIRKRNHILHGNQTIVEINFTGLTTPPVPWPFFFLTRMLTRRVSAVANLLVSFCVSCHSSFGYLLYLPLLRLYCSFYLFMAIWWWWWWWLSYNKTTVRI